jgi:hypothetical protein
MRLPSTTRRAAAALAAAVVLVAVAVYAVGSVSSSDDSVAVGQPSASPPPERPVGEAPPEVVEDALSLPGPLLVRAVDAELPDADGALFEVSRRGAVQRVGDAKCRVVHSSGGATLCVGVSSNGFDYAVAVLDERGRRRAGFRVRGVPSRARVSPDGRYGAFTMFEEEGMEYFRSTSAFSTRTRILDMRDGTLLLDLDRLDVTRDGGPVDTAEGEFWGVTFGEDGGYHATLATGRKGEHLLIEGRVGSEAARVVAEHVECPSLSPDGSRIAYKHRVPGTERWRLHVRELASGRDAALFETRSIDDQPEWLGDDLVAYSDGEGVYAVAASGDGAPRLLVAGATSPASLAR